MQLLFRQSLAILAGAASLVSGCAQTSNSPAPKPAANAREFDEADKAAAQALSVGNQASLQEAGSPYSRALLCTSSIKAMLQQLQATGMLSAPQTKAFVMLEDTYFRQLHSVGNAQGKTERDIEQDLQTRGAEDRDSPGNARITLACLRRLQGQEKNNS